MNLDMIYDKILTKMVNKGVIQMTKPVSLRELVEEMDFQIDESETFFHKPSGEFVLFSHEEMRAAEEDEPLDRFPEWEQEVIKNAIDLFENEDDYVPLPSKFEIHEWEIMMRFSLSLDDEQISDRLYDLIHGSGAFRRFKDAIFRYGIEDQWYEYKDQVLRKKAIEWCEENEIPYKE